MEKQEIIDLLNSMGDKEVVVIDNTYKQKKIINITEESFQIVIDIED